MALCVRNMIHRVMYVQSRHSGSVSAHCPVYPIRESSLMKYISLPQYMWGPRWRQWNIHRNADKSWKVRFLNPTIPFWKGARNVNQAIVWLLHKLALWESKIEQIYANNRLREITCKQQRQPGQQFRPSLVKKIFPSVTKSISYTSAKPW